MAFAMVITIIGFLLLLDKLGVISGEVWSYFWPILIIAIGLSMMYNKMYGTSMFEGYCAHCGDRNEKSHAHGKTKTSKRKKK